MLPQGSLTLPNPHEKFDEKRMKARRVEKKFCVFLNCIQTSREYKKMPKALEEE